MITLAYSAGTKRFTVRVSAATSYAGKVVSLQRRSGGAWKTVKTATLGGGGTVSFRSPLTGRATVRVLIPAAQSVPGYFAGVSATRTVTG